MHRSLGWVLLLSGALGFFIGSFAQAEWQVAVETAQVVAGTVRYSPDNPFYMYHVKLWTILHQILAVLLKMGFSERTLSILVSGVLGMVTFQAFAAVILALSGDALLALGGTVVIFFARPNEFGVVYPIRFLGAEHTYGILGLSYMLLVTAMLGGGWRRPGALLLGLAPAVHFSLGIWLCLAVGICCLWDIRHFRENWLPWLEYFLIGSGITIASLILQFTFICDLPHAPPFDAAKYFYSFVSFWDVHRAPVILGHPGVAFNGWVFGAVIAWLIFFRKDIPPQSVLLLRLVAVMTALGLAGMVLSWTPVEKVPRLLVMLMPARLLNFGILASLALLIGVVGFYRNRVWGQVLLLLLVTGVVCGGAIKDNKLLFFSSDLWRLVATPGSDPEILGRFMLHPWKWMALITLAAAAGAAVARWRKEVAGQPPSPENEGTSLLQPTKSAETGSPLFTGLRRVTGGVFAAVLILTLIWNFKTAQMHAQQFKDWTNNPVFAEAARGDGVLLTGGDLHLVQLRTRRPVLLDGGGLDGVAYVVRAAPMMEQILREVYKVDFFKPPEEARGQGAVPRWANKKAWEAISFEEWRALGSQYGFADVLTYRDWSLRLPRVAQDGEHILYRIPR